MAAPDLTVQACIDHFSRALGSVTPSTALVIVREAWEHFTSVQEWSFLRRGPVTLQGRAPIASTASVAWTQSTKTLTKAGLFADYALLAGDRVSVTAGTGLVARKSRIISRVSDDAITIEDDLGANAADATIQVDVEQLALPADYERALAYSTTDGFNDSLRFTSESGLLQAQTSGVPIYDAGYLVAAMWQDNPDGGNPVRTLGIFPALSTERVDIATIYYQRLPNDLNDETSLLGIPPYAHGLFKRFCQAVALGYYRENEADTEERIDKILESHLFDSVVARDGGDQPDFGLIAGGYADGGGNVIDWGSDAIVADPT